MRSLSTVGFALSLVFGCLLLALFAELYYLLWWKKRITNRDLDDGYNGSPATEFIHMFCCKKPSSLSSAALNPQKICSSDTHVHEPQAQQSKELWLQPCADNGVGLDTQLMRQENQNYSVPPRFLFTIKEETKEDLESEDGKSRGDNSRKGSRTRSLSDVILAVETPYLTPLASPSNFTPPLTPISSSHMPHTFNFNPFLESSTDAEFNRIRSSPPPKFKFLRDAEEKLHRRKMIDEADLGDPRTRNDGPIQKDEVELPSMCVNNEEYGSFITIVVDTNKEKGQNVHHSTRQCPSSSSQVLPLASSPSTFKAPSNKKPILH